MFKELFFLLAFVLCAICIQSFVSKQEGKSQEKVKWYTFQAAVEAQKKNPKPIMVDVYAKWCGPCRLMAANTFENSLIAAYLNERFYPVKFDAETYDSVTFNGYTFLNKNPPGTQRPVHDFAASILEGKVVYPSIVFLNDEIKKIQTITGYYKPDQFEPIIKYIGTGVYKTTSWEAFSKDFVSEIK